MENLLSKVKLQLEAFRAILFSISEKPNFALLFFYVVAARAFGVANKSLRVT